MNKSVIRIVIILSGISLVSLVILQFVWFKNMLQMRENEFDRDVMAAITETARRLERDQTMFFVSNRLRMQALTDTILASTAQKSHRAIIDKSNQSRNARFSDSIPTRPVVTVKRRQKIVQNNGGKEIVVKHENRLDTLSSMNMSIFFGSSMDAILPLPQFPPDEYYDAIIRRQEKFFRQHFRMMQEFDSAFMGYEEKIFPNRPRPRPQRLNPDLEFQQQVEELQAQTDLLSDALDRLIFEIKQLDIPARERLNVPASYEILKQELKNRSIDLPFEYAIFDEGRDTLAQSPRFNPTSNTKIYEANLLSDRFFQSADHIALYFPDRNTHLLSSMLWIITGSAFFTLILVATFIISILVILRQKKISDVKSDFINNMTHEFKTPIATISLAADSLVNARIINDPEKIHYFTRVIKEESKRMNTQVESVLQMALLDKKDFSLQLQPMDAHDLIAQAVQNISIQIHKREGEIQTDLQATNPIVEVDEVHFLNVLFNLLDNANKYSPQSPQIVVSTWNNHHSLFISVKDHGMGMDRETRNRAFEKFFRKSTGNIHNVKGFGLGLSYVKAIVMACGGNIRIESEPEKGSEFIIELPQINYNDESTNN